MAVGMSIRIRKDVRNVRASELLKRERLWNCISHAERGERFPKRDLCKLLTFRREGERIVLPGEADQNPDQEPGDIVFHLVEIEHPLFTRAGADLTAPLKVTLAEALCGFSRTVLIHLDGRGIHITHPQGKILKPGQTLKVIGEGMPHKKSDAKGDLYLIVDMEFPKDGWIKDDSSALQLQSLLPKPADPIHADTVDEVEYDPNGNIEEVSFDLIMCMVCEDCRLIFCSLGTDIPEVVHNGLMKMMTWKARGRNVLSNECRTVTLHDLYGQNSMIRTNSKWAHLV